MREARFHLVKLLKGYSKRLETLDAVFQFTSSLRTISSMSNNHYFNKKKPLVSGPELYFKPSTFSDNKCEANIFSDNLGSCNKRFMSQYIGKIFEFFNLSDNLDLNISELNWFSIYYLLVN